ncbi:unnamed protein product [Meganyctiphanes norvegica]|uniref:Uncharacterized protein n=1 Tax=Meganyctiphanes norvegica TaxID=48144 RepID=A0AAV2R284_MEGNR
MKVLYLTFVLVLMASLTTSAPHFGYGNHHHVHRPSSYGHHGNHGHQQSSHGHQHSSYGHHGHQQRYPGYQARPYGGGLTAVSPGGGARVDISGAGPRGGGVYVASNPGATHVANLPSQNLW